VKVSCLPVSFFSDILNGRMSIREWARIGAGAGLDAIDLSILFIKSHTPVYIMTLREELEAEGMPITMITTYPDFSNPDSLQRERELAYLQHDIALSSNVGAKYVRIVAGQAHPTTPLKDGINWVVENFKKVSSIGEKYGVRLVFENHAKPGAWYYSDFAHPTDIFLEIAERIIDTSIRINFDTANTLAFGDDPILVLQEVIERIETVHAADTAERGKLEPVLLGEGIVPLKEIFKILKQHGFDNWICIEDTSNLGEEGVRRANEFIRKTWSVV
jgi:sugar phosphate isomerase/epimerase